MNTLKHTRIVVKKYILTISFVIACVMSYAQDRTVTGVVYDIDGEPALGAAVRVPETSVAVTTNLDGQFTLKLPKGAQALEVSYVGCKTELVKITNASVYEIRLVSEDYALEEVVVIGYGTAKKSDLTGSLATLDGDKVEDRTNENVLGSIQGQMAGVEIANVSGMPGGELEVHVRGAASINASDQPLYVIDGIPVDDLSNLNPNDIKTIDVLKDAASAAIYGSRGANGVVLIKTRSADNDEKVTVQFSASFGLQQQERKLKVMSPSEWIEWRSDINNTNYVEKYGHLGASANDDYYTRLAYTGGSVSATMVNDPRWSQPGYGGLAIIDWQDAVYRIAPKQNYNLAVGGSTDRSNYRVSLGLVDQQGIARHTSFQRLNLRANLQTKVADRITIGFNVAPSVSWTKGSNPTGSDILKMVPLAEPEAGVYTGAQPYPYYKWSQSTVSPLAILEQTDKKVEDIRLQTSAFVRVDIMKGLWTELTGAYNLRSSQTRAFMPSSISKYWSSTPEGYYATSDRRDSRSHNWLAQIVAHYDFKVEKHSFNTMLGYSMENTTSNSSRLYATHFADNLLPDFDMTDVDLNNAYTSTGYPVRMISAFGRIQYDMDGRYLASVSLRGDGSSKFGKNKRWGLFPAFSLAWRPSAEAFWSAEWWVNSLKLRVSWGATGNNSITDGAAMGLMSSANYSLGGTLNNGYAPTSQNIDDLTWEKVYSWNIGVDFGILDNRITASADYYRKTTSSLLYKVTMPSIIGFTTMWDNIGEVVNHGIELEMRSINFSTKKFKWNTNFNLACNSNKVTDLGGNDKIFASNGYQVLQVGQPINSFYTYDAVGIYTKAEDLRRYPTRKGSQLGDVRYRDVNDDGRIDDRDRTLVGKPSPDIVLGLTNKFNYKGFDLSMLFNAQFGGYLYNYSMGRIIDNPEMSSNQNVFIWWRDMWRSEAEPGDGKTPSITSTTGDLLDTRWLYKSDFIRLKNITLGYKPPINKKVVRSARAFMTIENVWMWCPYDGGYSPENKGNNVYPQCRTYSLGINLNF